MGNGDIGIMNKKFHPGPATKQRWEIPLEDDETFILTYDSRGRIEYICEAPIGPHKWMDKVWALSRIMYDDNGNIGMITKVSGRHTYYDRTHLQYQDGNGIDGKS